MKHLCRVIGGMRYGPDSLEMRLIGAIGVLRTGRARAKRPAAKASQSAPEALFKWSWNGDDAQRPKPNFGIDVVPTGRIRNGMANKSGSGVDRRRVG
jgi:hypothetical protein